MGLDTVQKRRPFLAADVKNRDLVIKMLRYEDALMLGPEGVAIYADTSLNHLGSLETFFVFHRVTLGAFGFSTTDEDVKMYRTIFGTYYRSPTDFDRDVLGSVCYMRENKCVYYTAPAVRVGEAAPDVALETLSGAPTSLHAELAALPHKYVFVGAFSNS